MIDPRDKKEIREKDHYINDEELELIDDEKYIQMIADAFQETEGIMDDADDVDLADKVRCLNEDIILAEFGYIDKEEDE